MFAVLDRYEGQNCIAFRAPLDKVDELLTDARFTEAPYAARFGWVCLNIEGRIDWGEVERLVRGSYQLVALKRMLAALEPQGALAPVPRSEIGVGGAEIDRSSFRSRRSGAFVRSEGEARLDSLRP